MSQDWIKWRQIKMKALNASYVNSVKCPICGQIGKIKNMDCHHLIPRSVAPHLTFVAKNMEFVHKSCHKRIHKFMGDDMVKNIRIHGEDPSKMVKSELLERYLILTGFFKLAEDDGFNKSPKNYINPKGCPSWVNDWKNKSWKRY